jgi:hypothetical protein
MSRVAIDLRQLSEEALTKLKDDVIGWIEEIRNQSTGDQRLGGPDDIADLKGAAEEILKEMMRRGCNPQTFSRL